MCAALVSGCGSSAALAAGEETAAAAIELTGTGAKCSAGGVRISGSTVTISAAGTYSLSGELSGGQVIVDTGEEALKVTLILDNASVTNPDGPALWVKQAKKLDLVIAEGSVNSLVSGTEGAALSPDAAGAAIYAEDDLDIEGDKKGVLNVYGYINSGIVCKDDLDIKCGSCELNVTALNNGLKGSESVSVSGGVVTVEAGHDGIKASSAKKTGKGFVNVSGGILSLRTGGDGIAAETELNVSGGVVGIVTSGDPEDGSCKALKAKTGISISGGIFTVDSADHAVHSAAGINISGGSFDIKSGRKAVAAHGDISVSGGAFTLLAGDDGIETSGSISFSGGALSVSAAGNGVKSGENGTGGVTIGGGSILVTAGGDSFDAEGGLTVNNGSVLALGRSKRVKGFAPGSSQGYAEAEISGTAGSVVKTADCMLDAEYAYNLVLYSSPRLTKGGECEISYGVRSVTAEVK